MTTQKDALAAIVLAAGKGTRMKSDLPKVLHPVVGRPMVTYPVQAALDAGAQRVVVVVGHGAEAVTATLREAFGDRVTTAVQSEQRGTGDAARCGAGALTDFDGRWLILNGDAPLVQATALAQLVDRTSRAQASLGLMVSVCQDATGYGRILRDTDGRVCHIREQKDCSAEEAAIVEWNPGIYAVSSSFFRSAIHRLDTDNAQGELLLTDLVQLARAADGVADLPWPEADLHGVNNRIELAARARALQLRIARQHAEAGVTIADPDSTVIEPSVTIERDVTIEAQVHLRGETRIASGAHIDTGCVLRNATIGAGARLLPYTLVSDSRVGQAAQLGPFAHLRPGNELGDRTKVGNFVEMKKTVLGDGSKANHLSYLGDGRVGRDVNIGAGTIFCNYDGFNKHQTTLEDGVFVGSDSQLVAPVTIGKGAYVGTGTTVTQNVPADALAVSRTRQSNKLGFASKLKARFQALRDAANKA